MIRGYVKTFDDNKSISFFDDNKFIVKYKSIQRKIEELKFVGSVYDYKYVIIGILKLNLEHILKNN